MSDLPFSSDIRQFMYKIEEERTRITRMRNQRSIRFTDEESKWLGNWDMQLGKLSSLCGSVIDYEIEVRKNTNQSI